MAQYLPMGDRAVTVEFGRSIASELAEEVRAFTCAVRDAVQSKRLRGVIEVSPAYASATVIYDPFVIAYAPLVSILAEIEKSAASVKLPPPRVVEVPVCYGGAFGSDLTFVAEHCGLDVSEVIKIHTSRAYLVYMLGFMPGFAYLGGMDERIAAPRLSTPRTKIPAGSVGIAGAQTGMYALDSPGGWRLIGKTPVRLYNPRKEPPVGYAAGDMIRFVSISSDEFAEIENQQAGD